MFYISKFKSLFVVLDVLSVKCLTVCDLFAGAWHLSMAITYFSTDCLVTYCLDVKYLYYSTNNSDLSVIVCVDIII